MGKRQTPKEKRKIRQQIKAAITKEKKARLLNRPDFDLIPRIQHSVADDQAPRAIEDPGSRMAQMMQWSLLNADVQEEWSWGERRQWNEEDWHRTIHRNLSEFAKLTWAEIECQTTGSGERRWKKHHDMDVCVLVTEACKRWADMGLDEYETIFRFRLGGLPRLWGYRIRAMFFLVWWDRLHKIYPVD